MKFRFQIVFGKSRQNPRHASGRGRDESLALYSMTFDLTGEHQNKRFYVREIVLSLMFADVIFRRERSDDRKYVCGSQASCGRKLREQVQEQKMTLDDVELRSIK